MKKKVLTDTCTVAMNSGTSWGVFGVQNHANCVALISAFSAGSFTVL